jgi:hypothetical protein
MNGYAAGFRGDPLQITTKLSKANEKAFKRGYERGKRDREKKESIEEAKTFDPAKYTGPKYKMGDNVQIVRRFGWKKGYKPTPIKPPVTGTVKLVQRNVLHSKGPPALTLEIDPEDYGRASPKVVQTKYHRIMVHADEVERVKGESAEEGDMPVSEAFDPRKARDYVKGIQDRKRRAFAREYLKSISGIRLPPKPEDFRITPQAAREVVQGFESIGAPLAASVESPTFEQVARIVRRARGAGFTPGRVSLCEAKNYDFIFIVHREREDTYQVAHSVHDNPRLGYQELETGLSEKDAERMARKFKKRWKAKVKRFLVTGYGHKRVFMPESDEEIKARIKGDMDAEIKDPKNKGLTIAQTLLAMFGKDVDEARKWAPIWVATANRPWRLADQDGKWLRKPREGRVHEAYAFKTAEKALAFLKSSKGRKAATTQESTDEVAGLPLSKEEGWRAKRSAWQKEYRAVTKQFPELKDNKVVYDYGQVRTFKVEYVSADKKVKLALGKRIGKALLKRGYKLVGAGVYKTDKFMVQVLFTQKRAVLKVSGRRVEEAVEEAARLPTGPKLKNSVLNLRQSPWGEDEPKGPNCEVCRYFKEPTDCAILKGPVSEYQLCDGIQGKDDTAHYKIPSGKVLAFVGGMVKEQPYQHKVLKGVITPEGPLLIVQDTMKPTAHKFSLPWKFSIEHTSREHIWTQKEVDRLIAIGGKKTPVREDADEARRTVFVKKPKEEVNYRRSEEDRDGDSRCGNCAFVILPDECKRVRGKIDQDFICDLWKKGVAEGVDEARDYNRPIDPEKWGVSMFMVTPPGRSELHVMLPPDADEKLRDKIINSVSGQLITKTRKKMTWLTKGRRFKQELVAKIIRGWKEKSGWASESIDEAGAQGKVQGLLLAFVKQLPRKSEYTLADAAKRQEFRGVHFKRLMSAAKVLAKKGLIWYDGFSNVGPVKA